MRGLTDRLEEAGGLEADGWAQAVCGGLRGIGIDGHGLKGGCAGFVMEGLGDCV